MKKSIQVARNCPSCENSNVSLIYNNELAEIGGLDMSYKVGVCRQCGFLYANTLPPLSSYEKYYRTLSKYDQITSTNQIPLVDTIRANAVVKLCSTYLNEESIIADLGCGIGYLLSVFKQAGWQKLYGLDPAPNAAQRAYDLFGLNQIQSGMIGDSSQLIPLNSVNLVCLTGVLEHLWNPRTELQALFELLKPGTLIAIEVPALERFNLQPREPFGEFSLEHIQYFSEKSLCKFLSRLGAETIATTIIDLENSATDSLIGLFRITENKNLAEADYSNGNLNLLESYIDQSRKSLDQILKKLACESSPWIIYGAGSHTSRLLPMLKKNKLDQGIIAVIDGNQNLTGKHIGNWKISTPSIINNHPEATIIISSFHAQKSIRKLLETSYLNKIFSPYDI